MANILPLDKMSVEEKLQAMESLWDDLSRRAGGVASPARHEEVLTEREAAHKRGDDEFEDWDATKKDLKNKLS